MIRILAVDDDKDILEILQYILEDSGYQVNTLSNGTYFMENIIVSKPDLILLDVMLGGMDGRELCKCAKSLKETHDIPVILISASHDVSDSLKETWGPDDFIAKPFDIDVLLASVKRQLQNAA